MDTGNEITLEHEDVIVQFNLLHFDPVNPRGEPEPDEEVVRLLFGAQAETLQLATHIAEHGQNPLDRLGIIAHPKLPGHFVIREGNRRLCAMQLLRDPERAPTESTRKAFRKLFTDGRKVPDEIQAVLFHQKPLARVWMSVKHEGPQGGLGTLEWGSTEKTRFNKEGETSKIRPKNPNRQADALLSYAVDKGLIAPEERSLIALTTITRYLPSVRTALALLNSEDCTTNATLVEFDAALTRFLKDAIDTGNSNTKSPVHSRSNRDERREYSENLRAEGISPTNRSEAPYDPTSIQTSQNKPNTYKKPKTTKNPAKRKYLVKNDFVVDIKDDVLLRLVSEGKALNPDDARFSCNYLNRVILERVVYLYVKKNGIGGTGEFSEVIQRLINHAKQSTTPPSKAIINILTKTGDKRSSYSYEIMSGYVHGGMIPSGADNRVNWETMQPALEYLLLQLKK